MPPTHQRNLFSADTEYLQDESALPPWEIDDLKNRKIAKVAFPTGYDAVLDYLVPKHLAGHIEPGMRVIVPLGKGNRQQIGYCLDIQPWGIASTNLKLKQVQSLLDNRRLLDDKMLELTRWIAQYYLCPIGQVLEAILPAGVRDNAGTRLTTVLFIDGGRQTADGSRETAAVPAHALTTKQLHVLETLRQSPEPLTMQELQRAAKCSAVPINTLKNYGLISVQTIRRQKTEDESLSAAASRQPPAAFTLNADQHSALSEIVEVIEQRRYETFLLHGVTGSGKTEVYIQAIQAVVKRKKQAIVLVPEISLTPQTVGRFQDRFSSVAVLHSHLTDAERHRQWSKIASGEVQVVVGARSAVFAPLPRLGLIVIDEEHENSFKQDNTPRYHARDAARKRAELANIPLILGSATPSLESWIGVYSEWRGGCSSVRPEKPPRHFATQNAPPPQEGNYRNTKNYTALPYNPALKSRAQELRKAGNLSEVLFWNQVKDRQFRNLDFDRQKIIGNYIVDFYCANRNIVIEIDGNSHDMKQDEDAVRDAFLKNLGLHVIHIADIDIKKNIAAVMTMLENHPAFSHSPPLEGGHFAQQNDGVVSRVQGTKHEHEDGFKLLSMPRRVNNLRLPEVQIVDLREEVRRQMTRGAIHRQLHQAMHETLHAKGQIILLLNRRGFSTQIQCPACGEPVKCPNCDVSLTHHKSEEVALCHYCDYQIPIPQECPKCRFASVRFFGFGTQKLEAEVKSRFPDATVLRMDTDTMRGHGAHERALSQFRSGKVQILLGTQMIAKGLDFPNVMLVGVINADTALHFPDFRASERTFHLITQVAGRTGRGERGGRVIVQTFSPDHPAIMAAARHDYNRFVQQELPVRKALGYPPYSQMIRIVVRGEREAETLEFAKTFAEGLRSALLPSAVCRLPSVVLGPAPAPFAKLRNFYRFHIHLRSESGERLRESVRSVIATLKTPPEIQWIVDVDPMDML